MSTILVTGATGNIGSHLVGELHRRGQSARAFVRDVTRARTLLGEEAELAVGEYDDRASVAAALDGVDRLFLLTPSNPEMVRWEQTVLEAAAAGGVRLVVKISTVGADPESQSRFASWQGRCEELLRDSGLAAVILRSSYHMTNVLFAAETVRASGRIFAPLADAKISMIDRRDLAAVAAVTLVEEGHAGRTYVLTGPDVITYHDVAAALGTEVGRPVEYVDVPEEAALDAMLSAGLPDWMARGVGEVNRQVRDGVAAQTTDVVRVLTGREPHSFVDFVRDVRAAFS